MSRQKQQPLCIAALMWGMAGINWLALLVWLQGKV